MTKQRIWNEATGEFELIEVYSKHLEVQDLQKHEGHILEMGGRIWTLGISSDSAGDWAMWTRKDSTESYIYATPNYEGPGVPIDIIFDITSEASDRWKEPVYTFEEYIKAVKETVEEMYWKLSGDASRC